MQRVPLGARLTVEDGAKFPVLDIEPVKRVASEHTTGVSASLLISLNSGGKRTGTMVLTHSAPRHWLPEEVALAEDVGRQLGMAAERLRLQQALHASEERYRTFTEIATDFSAVVHIGSNRERQMVWERTDASRLVLGYTFDELHEMGGPLAIVLPEDRESAQVTFVAGRHPSAEFRIRTKDGEIRWMQRHGYFDAGDNGSGHYYLTLRDITRRKELEAKVLALRLEQERTALLTQFIRDAAHEFRTPLSIVHLNLHVTMRRCENPECRRRSETSLTQLLLITQLLDSMLTLLRLDYHVEAVRTLLDVSSLVASACDAWLPRIAQKGLALDTDFATALPKVHASLEDLSLAVHKLLENAVRYTEHGGIQVRTYAVDTGVVIEIQDSGSGMTLETQAHIFERFYRLDDAHTDAGFGLGLPIAQKVISSLHGEIEVESQLGEGSCFRVYLPTAQDVA